MEEDKRTLVSGSEYWEAAYREGRDGWDLGDAAPPLVRAAGWVEPQGEALVLGSGRGYEARLLARAGFPRVVGLDFAPSAAAEAASRTPPELASTIEWRTADLFDLGRASPGLFALAVEHTSYCAIDPSRRGEWLANVHAALTPGGRLLALFYTHPRAGGPPFGGTVADTRNALIRAGFAIEREEVPADSVDKRAGDEWLVLARKA